MNRRPLFVLFGIPVSVDPVFVVGAIIIYSFVGGGRRGWITLVSLAVLVLVHEMGHALTARAYGCESAVVLTILGGFTHVRGKRHLSSWQSDVISLAGPLTQIALALVGLFVGQRLVRSATDRGGIEFGMDLFYAIAWGGVLLGLANLLPLWPLDGGHIAERMVIRVFGPRGVRPYLWCSVAVSAVLLATSFVAVGRSYDQAMLRMQAGVFQTYLDGLWSVVRAAPLFLLSLFFIPLFTLLGSLQQLNAGRRVRVPDVPSGREMRQADAVAATRSAERSLWSGEPAEFPRGWEPSPWVRAHLALSAGEVEEGVNALAGLADERSRNWLLDRVDRPQIGMLLAYVPPQAAESLAVLEARVHHGSAEELVAAASRRFAEERSGEPLYLGAAGLAVRGLDDDAMAWLRRAVETAPDPHRLATMTELSRLHHRADFQQLLGAAQRATGMTGSH